MWKSTFNVIVAFSTATKEASLARKALGWGSMHLVGQPFIAPINGIEHEVRTYQFLSAEQRQLFKVRVAKALTSSPVHIEMEDEAGRVWSPDRQRPTS